MENGATKIHTAIEVSVVMPCLNEAETLASCIEKARRALCEHHISGEIIVADNSSTDGSPAIATRLGVRVVHADQKGYGNALRAGIAAARGQYVIIGDADDSYDFSALMPFVSKLREGYDLVMGNRFQGGIAPGAMPLLHRYVGNPILTTIGRLFFKSACGDFHCGMRAIRKAAALQMDLCTTGMEFASEMVIKATLYNMQVAEVPTTLSPDGRSRPPHLRRWRDGWRHLRFLLLYSPRWLFFYPGCLLMLSGLSVGMWLSPGPRTLGSVTFDVHTLLFAAMAVLVGFQAVLFAVFGKVFAMGAGLLPATPRWRQWLDAFSLERGLLAGGLLTIFGLIGSVYALSDWGARSFGPLDPTRMLRIVIPSVLLILLGCQTLLASFFLSMLCLGWRWRDGAPPAGAERLDK